MHGLTQIRHHDPQSRRTFAAWDGRGTSSHQKAWGMWSPLSRWRKSTCQKKRKHSISPLCAKHITTDNGSWGSLLLPETRGGCVWWGLPTQTLGEELRQGRGSGPGSRRGGRACACSMVGAALPHWGAHTQLHQQAKELSQSPTQSRWSCKDTRLVRYNKFLGI